MVMHKGMRPSPFSDNECASFRPLRVDDVTLSGEVPKTMHDAQASPEVLRPLLTQPMSREIQG